jgi:hypothetical protein
MSWVAQRVPGAVVPNPLDGTGFVGRSPGLWEEIIEQYSAADEFDVLLLAKQHADWSSTSEPHDRQLVDAVRNNGKVTVLAPLAATAAAWWTSSEQTTSPGPTDFGPRSRRSPP